MERKSRVWSRESSVKNKLASDSRLQTPDSRLLIMQVIKRRRDVVLIGVRARAPLVARVLALAVLAAGLIYVGITYNKARKVKQFIMKGGVVYKNIAVGAKGASGATGAKGASEGAKGARRPRVTANKKTTTRKSS